MHLREVVPVRRRQAEPRTREEFLAKQPISSCLIKRGRRRKVASFAARRKVAGEVFVGRVAARQEGGDALAEPPGVNLK